MDDYIKNCADNFDLKTLKYIFVDALEVDPTFVRYEEEYRYCLSTPGLLEPHQELTPFSDDPSNWDDDYWENLKMDLLQNFSDRRMMHMKDVAQLILAEKVERILQERSAADTSLPVDSVTPDFDASSFETSKNTVSDNASGCESLEGQTNNNPDVIWSDTEYRWIPSRLKDQAKKALGIAIVVLAVIVIVLILILQ